MAGLVPRLPRLAWLVFGGDALSAVGSGLTLPFLLVYLHQIRGISYGLAGLAVSTLAFASISGNLLSGALADRFGARQALMGGLIISAAGSLAMAYAQSPRGAFAAAALIGFGAGIIWPSQDALLAQLVSADQRSAGFSVRHATMNVGLGLGALVAAAIIEVGHPGTFQAVYLLDALSFLLYAPLLLVIPARQGATHNRERRMTYRDILRDRTFLWLWALSALVITVSYGMCDAAFPAFATRPGGISPGSLGVAFAANTLTVVGAQLIVLRLLRGRRRSKAVALAACTWALTWAIVLAAGRLGSGPAAATGFAAAMVIFAFGECLLSPTLPAIVNDMAPPEAQGRYNGLGTLAWTTGFIAGPAISGSALSRGWATGLFMALIPVCGLAALAAVRLGHRLPATMDTMQAAEQDKPAAEPDEDQLEQVMGHG
jgi:MFS family permease